MVKEKAAKVGPDKNCDIITTENRLSVVNLPGKKWHEIFSGKN